MWVHYHESVFRELSASAQSRRLLSTIESYMDTKRDYADVLVAYETLDDLPELSMLNQQALQHSGGQWSVSPFAELLDDFAKGADAIAEPTVPTLAKMDEMGWLIVNLSQRLEIVLLEFHHYPSSYIHRLVKFVLYEALARAYTVLVKKYPELCDQIYGAYLRIRLTLNVNNWEYRGLLSSDAYLLQVTIAACFKRDESKGYLPYLCKRFLHIATRRFGEDRVAGIAALQYYNRSFERCLAPMLRGVLVALKIMQDVKAIDVSLELTALREQMLDRERVLFFGTDEQVSGLLSDLGAPKELIDFIHYETKLVYRQFELHYRSAV